MSRKIKPNGQRLVHRDCFGGGTTKGATGIDRRRRVGNCWQGLDHVGGQEGWCDPTRYRTHFLLATLVAGPLDARLPLLLVVVAGEVVVTISTARAAANHADGAPLALGSAIGTEAGGVGHAMAPGGDRTCRAHGGGRTSVAVAMAMLSLGLGCRACGAGSGGCRAVHAHLHGGGGGRQGKMGKRGEAQRSAGGTFQQSRHAGERIWGAPVSRWCCHSCP
jgi:hypothetical protein